MREYIVANCETASLNGTYIPDPIDGFPGVWYIFDGETVVGRLTCDEYGTIGIEDFLTYLNYYNTNWEILLPTTPDDPEITWVYWDESLQEEVPSSLTITGGAWRFVFNLATPAIIVSGAGEPSINGEYYENGTAGGKPYYERPGCNILWATLFEGEGWYITGERRFYYSADDVATPDLVTTWTLAAYGSPPLPTVTAFPKPTYKLTGTDATLTYTPIGGSTQNLTLTCEAGSYSLTGTNADLTVQRNYTLVCESGSGGTSSDIVVSGAGTSDANGTYTYAGELYGKPYYSLDGSVDNLIYWVDIQTYKLWVIANNTGVLYESTDDVATPDLVTTWTAVNDGSLPVPTVTAGAATTYVLTGTDVTLTVQRNYTLVCEPGSYTLTGTNITFGNSKAYSLTCEAGAYTLTGSSVSFVIQRNYSLACETGSYTLTGTDADLVLLRNYILACEAGSYALTGTNAGLTSARTMACNAGSYALTGTNADLTVTYSAGGVPKQYLHYARLRSN